MASRERILSPYTSRVDDLRHRLVKFAGVSLLLLLAVLMGFVIGVFGIYGWFIPAIPVALMALVSLWIAPDVGTDAGRLMAKLFLVFYGILLIWPNYIAVNIPGLPWISLRRTSMFALAAVALYSYATSSGLRRLIGDIARSEMLLTKVFVAWVAWQTFMLAVGKFSSFSSWVDMLFLRYLLFFLSAWFVIDRMRVRKFVHIILAGLLVTSAITIPEYVNQRPFWAGHIPHIFAVDPDLLEDLLFPVLRAGMYRARSVFANSLAYAEYLGMLFPFALLALSWARTTRARIACILLILLAITAAFLTQARTALIAIFVGIPLFSGIWVWKQHLVNKSKNSLVTTGLVSLFPLAAIGFVTITLASNRLRARVFGGSTQADSNDARGDQWALAIPEIRRNPLGYGMGTVREHVPYTIPGGKWTIDSYPINLLVETGVPGLLLFFGLFLVAAWIGFRIYLHAGDKGEEEVAGAVAVGLISFMLSRLVLSMDGSTGMAFSYAGIVLGLWYVQQRRLHEADVVPTLPVPAKRPFQSRVRVRRGV